MINILKHNWKFPVETVYVLGTGPKGLEHHSKIPWDAWVIGVNKAIQLNTKPPKVQPEDIRERMAVASSASGVSSIPLAFWLCADTTLPTQKWFTDEVQVTIDCGFDIDNSLNPTPIFSTSPTKNIALTKVYPDVPYYFTHGYSLRERPAFVPLEGMLRAGGSISAQAIQLAYWLGAKRIVLVGVDMAGDTYFDGTKNINSRLKPDGISLHCRMCDGLCQWLTARGIEVVSLSPTALNVEVI